MVAHDMFPPGLPAHCPVCQRQVRVEPTSVGDAVCPSCGTLVWPVSDRAIVDRYRVVARLGYRIYRAVGPDQEDVVLRFLPAELCKSEMVVRRWIQGANLTSGFDHPNLLPVKFCGVYRGQPFQVTEFVNGPNAQELMETRERLDVPFATDIIKGCCQALAYVHQQGIIHRDVKPENMMIAESGIIRLRDFGLSKLADEETSMTEAGVGLGIPLFMPPEQARNAKLVDHRSEIYALGACFYYFVTGKFPFVGDTVIELIMAKEAGRSIPVQEHTPDVPASIPGVIHKMMASNPDDRHASCQQVLDELAACEL